MEGPVLKRKSDLKYRLHRRIGMQNNILRPDILLLILLTTALNCILSSLMGKTGLPFYLDTAGTVISAVLGGIIPGITTALLTNFFNFMNDGEAIFYSSLNMLIAVAASGFFEYKKKRKIHDYIIFVLLTAVIGGFAGGLITWFLYREPSDSPMIVNIMNWYSAAFGMSEFGSHMVASFIADVMDKTISFLLAMIIIRAIPLKIKKRLWMPGWFHKKISLEEQKTVTGSIKGYFSIGLRTILVIVLSTCLVTAAVIWFGVISYEGKANEIITEDAAQAGSLAASFIDPDMTDDYARYGTAVSGYEDTLDTLEIIRDSSMRVTRLYVYKPEDNGFRVVFDPGDGPDGGNAAEGAPAGTLVAYEDYILPYKDSLQNGDEIPPVTADTGSGYIIVFTPVRDDSGHTVCYVVTYSETILVESFTTGFVGRAALLFAGFLILVLVIAMWIARYRIVMPVAGMTRYAEDVAYMDDSIYEQKLKKMESLDVRTGDELELLYNALCKMTGDTVRQMNDLKRQSDEISKMQNGLIVLMADMVESRDSDTGAHIQKTAAYVRIILNGLKRNGYYIEKLTPKYMSDVEMSAPLHDIGKINIPDAVLNKPGKLTDEEFAIMKSHTTAGRDIIAKAISTVEGDTYLKEALNMAAYHHERWDGRGYPEGLHGEVIPLSARVMSVADVFDALVSPRIYKPPFPLEKALDIIREGAGAQFDPKCVEVFMESLPEVIKIMNKYKES